MLHMLYICRNRYNKKESTVAGKRYGAGDSLFTGGSGLCWLAIKCLFVCLLLFIDGDVVPCCTVFNGAQAKSRRRVKEQRHYRHGDTRINLTRLWMGKNEDTIEQEL